MKNNTRPAAVIPSFAPAGWPTDRPAGAIGGGHCLRSARKFTTPLISRKRHSLTCQWQRARCPFDQSLLKTWMTMSTQGWSAVRWKWETYANGDFRRRYIPELLNELPFSPLKTLRSESFAFIPKMIQSRFTAYKFDAYARHVDISPAYKSTQPKLRRSFARIRRLRFINMTINTHVLKAAKQRLVKV